MKAGRISFSIRHYHERKINRENYIWLKYLGVYYEFINSELPASLLINNVVRVQCQQPHLTVELAHLPTGISLSTSQQSLSLAPGDEFALKLLA